MSEIVIVARIIPEHGQTELVRAAIDDLAVASRAEAGNKGYDVFVSSDQASEFLIYEIWANAEAIANHATMPHMITFKEMVKGKTRISVQKLVEL